MIPLTVSEIAAAVGGTMHDIPDPQERITGPVVVDSRVVEPGGLFVAVAGEHLDGHEFARPAVRAGATAVLATRPVGVPAIVVDDVVAALGALARTVTGRLGTTVIALTGSAGKTSTKDMIAQVLARLGPTVYPPGSFNNEIGLPLTALRADATTRHLVLEMGARAKGHIRYLAGLTPPRIGVVLNVGSAHIGEFGGREAIAAAKGELVEALPATGLAVLNADDPLVSVMGKLTQARVVRFGEAADADVRADDIVLDAAGRPAFTLRMPGGSARVALPLYGAHHVPNALAASCVAGECGMAVADIAAALATAGPLSSWRMEVTNRADGVTIVNDAYNANPDSMQAALRALRAIADGAAPPGGRRRTWAVLGEMRELGDHSLAEHSAVGRLAVSLGVNHLVAVGGKAAAWLEAAARNSGSLVTEPVLVSGAAAAIELLRDRLRPGDVVLVKASRAAGLERVALSLLADGASRGGEDR